MINRVGSGLIRLRPLSAIGLGLFCLSFWARFPGLNKPYNYFDEGLILTYAHLIRLGSLPYRDFYTNYGPGTFLLAAALWRTLGIAHLALALRVFAILVHFTISVMSGRLAGRVAGQHFSWLACGLVSLWLVSLGTSPFAWNTGLALALISIELLHAAIDRPTRLRFVLAGLSFGLLSTIRHDVLVYLTLVLGCSWALPVRVYKWADLSPPPRRKLGWLALGAAIAFIPVWVPLLVHAGLHRIIDDLFLTQVRYVMPGRVLPLPKLFTGGDLAHLSIWRNRFEGAITLTFVGPFLAALLLALRRPLRIDHGGMTIVSLGCLAMAILPQMLGRSDWVHAVFTVTPALTLLSALIELLVSQYSPSWWLKMPLVLSVVALLSYSNWSMVWPPTRRWPHYVGTTTYALNPPRPGFYEPNPIIAEARRAVLAFIALHSSSGDAIYVGTQRHDRVFVNEPDLYFLANRRAGTRYTQFDPNVVTRLDVQREMIASLEQTAVKILVLSNRADLYESQSGVLPGSTLFDEYIRRHFRIAERHPPYILYTRID